MAKHRRKSTENQQRIVTIDNAIVRGTRKRPSADEIAARNAAETGRKIRAIFAQNSAEETRSS